MKIVDISAFDIVKPGIEFQIQSTTPRDEGSPGILCFERL
jgi:hypothetical protein